MNGDLGVLKNYRPRMKSNQGCCLGVGVERRKILVGMGGGSPHSVSIRRVPLGKAGRRRGTEATGEQSTLRRRETFAVGAL